MVQSYRVVTGFKALHSSYRYVGNRYDKHSPFFERWNSRSQNKQGCIFAELITTKPIFPGTEQNPAALQKDQIEKIANILGKPTPSDWPEIVQCQHWPAMDSWSLPSGSKLKNWFHKSTIMSTAAHDLLEKLLIFDPSKRITAKECLKHNYFKEDPLPSNKFLLLLLQTFPVLLTFFLSQKNSAFSELRHIIYPDRKELVKQRKQNK